MNEELETQLKEHIFGEIKRAVRYFVRNNISQIGAGELKKQSLSFVVQDLEVTGILVLEKESPEAVYSVNFGWCEDYLRELASQNPNQTSLEAFA